MKGSRNKININEKESYATFVKVGKSSLKESAIYKIVFWGKGFTYYAKSILKNVEWDYIEFLFKFWYRRKCMLKLLFIIGMNSFKTRNNFLLLKCNMIILTFKMLLSKITLNPSSWYS